MDEDLLSPWMTVNSTRANNPDYVTLSDYLDDLDAISPGTEAILADYLPPIRLKHHQYSPRHHRKAVNKPRNLRDQTVLPMASRDENFLLEGTGSLLISKKIPGMNSGGNENAQSRCINEDEEIPLPRIPSSLAKNPKIFEAGLQRKDRPKQSMLSRMKYNEKMRREIELNAQKYIFTLQQPSMISRGSKAIESVHNLMSSLKMAKSNNAFHKNSSSDTNMRKQRLYGNTSGMKRNVEEPLVNLRPATISPRKSQSPKIPIFQLEPVASTENA